MIRIFRDSYRTSLVLAAVFMIAALFSIYKLYSLPGNLMLPSTLQGVMIGTYLAVAITFILGGLAIYLALTSKRELIVYKEKSDEQLQNEGEAGESKNSISLQTVQASLQSSKENKLLYQDFLQAVCKQLEAGQGAFYLASEEEGTKKVTLTGGYALHVGENSNVSYEFGEGFVGQAAAEGRPLHVDDIPEGYIKIISGLGSASPRYLMIVPIQQEDKVLGVMEIASFASFHEDQKRFVEEAVKLLVSKKFSK